MAKALSLIQQTREAWDEMIIWALIHENLTLLHANYKDPDQPGHPRSLISAYVIVESIYSS